MPRVHLITALSFLFLIITHPAHAMMTAMSGSPDRIDPDWPPGIEHILALPTLYENTDGPLFGNVQCHFKGKSTADFQAALDAFAKIQSPGLNLQVLDGFTTAGTPPPPSDRFTVGKPVYVFDRQWTLSLMNRKAMDRNGIGRWDSDNKAPAPDRPLPPPQLTLYLGAMNPVVWEDVRMPDNVKLFDRRVATSRYSDSTGGVVVVTLRDMLTSKPLAGAQIEVGKTISRKFETIDSALTDESGQAVIKNIPRGSYTVVSKAPGYATRGQGYFTNHGRTLIQYESTISPIGTLRGAVFDSQGKPIREAEVSLLDVYGVDGTDYNGSPGNGRVKAETDMYGNFSFDSLPVGQAIILVNKEGYHFFNRSAYAVPGNDIKIVMTARGTIQGRVIGAESIPSDKELRVWLEPIGEKIGMPGARSRPINADLTFAIPNLPANRYSLKVLLTSPGEEIHTEFQIGGKVHGETDVELKAGQTAELQIEYRP